LVSLQAATLDRTDCFPPTPTTATMAQRKSTAQLKRLQKRAEQRGESYDLVVTTTTTTTTATKKLVVDGNNKSKENKDEASSAAAAAGGGGGAKTPTTKTTTATTATDCPSSTTTTTTKNKGDHEEENEEEIAETQAKEPANKRVKVNVKQQHEESSRSTTQQQQEPKDDVEQKSSTTSSSSSMIAAKKKVAMELQKELQAIEANPELKAKDRRSAKREAEAIAVEQQQTGGETTSAQELLDWLATYNDNNNNAATRQEEDTSANKESNKKKTTSTSTKPNKPSSSRAPTPNILFVGQLSFDTTKEEILACFRKHLIETEKMKVANDALSVRLLTHAQTGKSKGMAFLEIKDADTDDPLIVYSCLKLHHTYINGRRINVERTSGGGKATKQTKVATLRQHQVDYMKETVQSILKEYDTSSLDEGVLALCERHNATVVHAGMERFVETNGPDKENPSAYLTALLHKLATEGIYDRTKPKNNNDNNDDRRNPSKTGRSSSNSGGGSRSRDNVRQRTPDTVGRSRPGGGSNNRGRR
jgi:RNA recognition motif-containing protein